MTNEKKNDPFCGRLNFLIGKSGDQKKAFAKNCGISEKQIFSYLNGKAKPGMKFFGGIKEYYPQFNIDWLVSGQGEPFIDNKNVPTDSVLSLQYNNIIQKFDDKEFALEISQALMSVEKTSLKEFYKLGGYIKALSESGIEMRTESGRSLDQQNDPDVWDGTERRSGEDRRKSVHEDLPPARKNDAPTG